MLVKSPKSSTRKWLKRGAFFLIAAEGVSFLGSYFLCRKRCKMCGMSMSPAGICFMNDQKKKISSIFLANSCTYRLSLLECQRIVLMARVAKSIFWLAAFTGLGYGLLGLTKTPEEIKKISRDLPGAEKDPRNIYKEKQKFINTLEAAAKSEKPFYLLTKEEIEATIRR
ncbi:hypothetical protein GWI33_002070 [Rhynchophorus ferrugineus]|uniref:Ubiquinol-cytochrome-c reductase complex assembly factor 3 n=1 Tax=Rhynchophorus ferrugineus TaxID=354439 RepID=A0A834IUE6_RHYFE|nr:hypothetical protein GWI33_002070 [Rhynchophorus ferrugineus]